MGGGSIFREKGHAFHQRFKRISDLSPRRKGASGLCAKVQVLCGSRTISFRLGPALPAQFSVFPLQLGASQTGWSQDQPEALGPSPGDSDSEGPSGGIGVGVEGAPQESASNERNARLESATGIYTPHPRQIPLYPSVSNSNIGTLGEVCSSSCVCEVQTMSL